MIRRFLVLLTFVCLVIPGMANALGLGEATVKSSLNQPLDAEIQLTNVRNLGLDEILPGLASREDFLKAGVDRVYFLSDLHFKVVKKTDGKYYIHVTSQKVVREPFLNFLIEVIWPSGRLLREYALLIDPPLFNEEKPAPVAAAPTTSQAQSTATVPAEATSVETTQAAPATEMASQGSDTYGPTKNSDTLWGLALKLRPNKQVSPQQTMLAIQDLNPDAFIGGNINKLKAGQVLRKPTLADIKVRTREQAVAQVNAQNRRLHNKALAQKVVDATKPAAAETAPSTPQKKQGSELKLIVADNHSKNSEAKGSHAGSNKNAPQASKSSVENQLSLVSEQLDKTKLENQDLSGQVKDLKEQLSTLQRLLALKNDQLASLQAADQKAKAQPEALGSAPVANQPANTQQTAAKTETTASTPKEASPAAMKVPSADTASKTEVAQAPKEAPKSTVKPKVIIEAPKASNKPETANQDLQGIVSQIMSNPVYMAIAAGVFIAILLLLLLLSKRSAQKEKDYLSQLSKPENESDDDLDLDLDESINLSDDEGSLDLNDQNLTAKSDSSDVISEAEVYIAYQRLDQAAQILEDGISSEPGRTDIRIKLLEVYKLAGNVDGFEKQYNELAHMDDDYALEQAKLLRDEMGDLDSDITIDDLESQLLSSGENNFSPSDINETGYASDDTQQEDDFNVSLDLDEPSEAADTKNDGLDVDFDISDLDLDEEATKTDDNSIDFDLGGLDEEAPVETPESELDEIEEVADEATSEEDTDGIDLSSLELSDLDDTTLDESLDELAGQQEQNEADDGLSLDDLELDSLDLEENQPVASEDESMNLDDIDSLDLDAESSEEPVSQDTLDIDDLDLDLDEEMASALANAEGLDGDLSDAESIIESLDEPAKTDVEDDSSNETSTNDLADDAHDDLEQTLDMDADLESTDAVEEETDLSSDFDDSLLDEALEVTSDDQFIEESVSEGEENEASDELVDAESAEDEDFDFLNETDEAATKLDLARAYVDMGDAEGARDILEEVAIEGNEQQKQDALALLKSLG